MKKFTFSLQKLLNYKEQVFDIERGILADMNAVLHQMREELSSLQQELRKGSQELNQKYAEGITALEILSHKTYLTAVGDAIIAQRDQIELQRQAIDRQMDKVREAKIEISTMEKLREKKVEEYNYMAQKAEDLFIEEFVSNQRAMADDN